MEHINHFTQNSLCNLFYSHGYKCLTCGEKPFIGTFPSEVPEIFGVFTPVRRMRVAKLFDRDFAALSCMTEYVSKSSLRFAQIDAWLKKELELYSEIIVWGTGQLALKLLGNTVLRDAKITAFTDGNPIYHGRQLCGVRVCSPQDIVGLSQPILIASILHTSEIETRLRDQLHLTNKVLRIPEVQAVTDPKAANHA